MLRYDFLISFIHLFIFPLMACQTQPACKLSATHCVEPRTSEGAPQRWRSTKKTGEKKKKNGAAIKYSMRVFHEQRLRAKRAPVDAWAFGSGRDATTEDEGKRSERERGRREAGREGGREGGRTSWKGGGRRLPVSLFSGPSGDFARIKNTKVASAPSSQSETHKLGGGES